MPDEIYELIAQGARYWFVFLMALIAWRSWRWYRKDKKKARKRLKLLPDAGFVGEMVVVQAAGSLRLGQVLPVPREGTLGTARTNDLYVPVPGVSKKHLWFRFDDGEGLMVEPFGRQPFTVDGAAFTSRREPLYMAHGSRLCVGEAVLRLRLFAGFECIGRAPRYAGPEAAPVQPEPQPDAAQQMAYQQWMQQQWMMQQEAARQQAWQEGYQQAMAQQQTAVQDMPAEEPEDGMTDVYTYEEARSQGMVDHRAFMRPAGEKKPELPVYDPAPEGEFFLPVTDDEEEIWSGFEEAYDEEINDADAPPKSAYVGHDEAEKAKRQVWDKYLGGGPQ